MKYNTIAAREYLAACSRTRISDAIAVLWSVAVLAAESGSSEIETTLKELRKMTATVRPGSHLKTLHTAKMLTVHWTPQNKVKVKVSERAFRAIEVFGVLEAPPEQKTEQRVVDVIDCLNKNTGRSFTGSAADLKLIRARYNEGYSFDDFVAVISVKCEQWLHDERMSGYLRPQTLFASSKFDGYLQESKSVKPTQSTEAMFESAG